MPYKISGTTTDLARVIVIDEATWTVEYNQALSIGNYEISDMVSGTKWVMAMNNDGQSVGYGHINSIFVPGDRGIFVGGDNNTLNFNTIDYIAISTLSNASDFGDLSDTDATNSQTAATSNGANDRGVIGGGYTTAAIEYVSISSLGNAGSFGNLTVSRRTLSSTSNNTNNRGIFAGGAASVYTTRYNTIDYITITSIGNATDFGDLVLARGYMAGTSNATSNRGVFAGGQTAAGGTPAYNTIEYITISTTGNTQDFGDLTISTTAMSGKSNNVNDRGLFSGGYYSSARMNTIDYITISTLGNAQDFGDLTVARSPGAATSNGINNRGVDGGGYNGTISTNIIDYVNITVLSNALDFGDLTVSRHNISATSNA